MMRLTSLKIGPYVIQTTVAHGCRKKSGPLVGPLSVN